MRLSSLATDLVVLRNFKIAGEKMAIFYNFQMGSLLTSLGLLFVIVYFQHRKRGSYMVLFQEWFFVVTATKAGRDAYKVAMNLKHEEGALVDPFFELSFAKGVEMLTESIPGVLIQTAAILYNPELGFDITSIVSILVSSLTTGFTSAQISYDFDTSPEERAKNPFFYGYVPDDSRSRTILFVTMAMNPAIMLLIKSLAIVLLAFVNAKYVAYFFAFDIGLFLLVKIARGDFLYWVPLDKYSRYPGVQYNHGQPSGSTRRLWRSRG